MAMPSVDLKTGRRMAYGTAIGRIVFGSLMLIIPALTLGGFGVKLLDGPLAWLARVFGIRDIVLGAGTIAALQRNDGSAANWVRFSAIADGADALLAFAKPDELGRARSYVAGAFALSAAIPGALAANALESKKA
jgi:hypothetical protein